MADEWAWNLYERAICAHMRGDPQLAVASLSELEKIRPAVLKLMILEESEKPHSEWKPMEWASQAADLKSECERRIKIGKIGMINEAEFLAGHLDLPALIRALDRLAIRQRGPRVDLEMPFLPPFTGKSRRNRNSDAQSSPKANAHRQEFRRF